MPRIPANSPYAPPHVRAFDEDGNPISIQTGRTVMQSPVSGNYTNPLAMMQGIIGGQNRRRFTNDVIQRTADANRALYLSPDRQRTSAIDDRRREMNLVTNRGRTERQKERDEIYRNQARQRNEDKKTARKERAAKEEQRAAKEEQAAMEMGPEYPTPLPYPAPSNESLLVGPEAPTNEIPEGMEYVPPMEEDPDLIRLGVVPAPESGIPGENEVYPENVISPEEFDRRYYEPSNPIEELDPSVLAPGANEVYGENVLYPMEYARRHQGYGYERSPEQERQLQIDLANAQATSNYNNQQAIETGPPFNPLRYLERPSPSGFVGPSQLSPVMTNNPLLPQNNFVDPRTFEQNRQMQIDLANAQAMRAYNNQMAMQAGPPYNPLQFIGGRVAPQPFDHSVTGFPAPPMQGGVPMLNPNQRY